MNKPPGYYKDERGREYYWDGRTRSYIPDDTLRRFQEGMNRATPIFVWGYMGVVLLPFIALLVLILGWVVWEVAQSPVVIVVVLVITFFVIVYGPRWNENLTERNKAEAKKRIEERNKKMRQENEELRAEAAHRAEAAQRARAEEQQENERQERVRLEAVNRQVEELDETISTLLAEGIRENVVGKTAYDFKREGHSFDFEELFGGMSDEEVRRHTRYITANTERSNLRSSGHRFRRR